MEDSSECLADSVNLGPESCSVFWEGFEPWLSFYFYVWELSLKILDSIFRSRISCWISGSLVLVSFWCSWAKCFSTSDLRSSTLDSFARLFTISSLIPAIAFFSPASSLAVGETHAVSSGWSLIDVSALDCSSSKTVSACSVLRRALLTTPERSWSSMFSILLALLLRALSACRSALSAALLKRDVFDVWAPVISAVQLRHLLHILWPVMIKPESRIYPSSQSKGSFCCQTSSRVFYRRHQSQTVHSLSCLGGDSHWHGSFRCRTYQPDAFSGPLVLPALSHLACSEHAPRMR